MGPSWQQAPPAGPVAASAAPCASLYYDTLPDFVTDFTPLYARNFDGRERTWCPAWWKHTEAVVRLDAIWRAWEHLHEDPNVGMSSWLRDHGDHHMTVLMASDGPFKGCSPTKGHSPRDWRNSHSNHHRSNSSAPTRLRRSGRPCTTPARPTWGSGWRDYAGLHVHIFTEEAGSFFDRDAAASKRMIADTFLVDDPRVDVSRARSP